MSIIVAHFSCGLRDKRALPFAIRPHPNQAEWRSPESNEDQ
jgi:hypothetical protein